jgi:hypothetical protein
MRKKIRKLALTKETLRSLEDPKLEDVNGGATTTTQPDTCPVRSCNICTNITRICSVCCP